MRHIRTLLLLTVALSAAAQTIDPGGVVNAASHTETVAPGSIAAVFGSFPWNAPAQVFSAPLPTNLSDVYLQFDGSLRGPLVYVSGGQVDIQIPWELAGRSQAELSVTAGGLASAPRTVSLAQYAPAIFHIDGRGTIQDSSFRPIDPSNPARAGSTTILIYCTGLGPVTNQPASGAAAPASPLSATTTTPAVTIGGVPAQVLSSALVPGLVGLYQGYLVGVTGAHPTANGDSILSQIGAAVFAGRTLPYYILIFSTMGVLVLAAQTSFADFPRLSSILARDGFFQRQFAFRGDRLAFNAGIIALAAISILLVLVFEGNVNALIPLYAIGVFTSFTL